MPQKEPKSALEKQIDRIERTGETASVRLDAVDKHLLKASELLESVITQIASLSEQITRFENATAKRLENIDDRLDKLTSISERQSATAETLANTVALLIQRSA